MDGELEHLGERIAEQAAHLDAATYRLLMDLHEFDERGGWAKQGALSCAHWLSWRVGWSLVMAREHVRVAGKLPGFPTIGDALRRGEVSYSKVRAMLRVATAANEFLLLEHARLMPAAHLEKVCRKYALVQQHGKDPHPLGDLQRRCVRRRDTEDGMVKIEAILHAEEAELVWTMLNHASSQLTRDLQSSADPEVGTAMSRSEPSDNAESRSVRLTPPASSASPSVEASTSATSRSTTDPQARAATSPIGQTTSDSAESQRVSTMPHSSSAAWSGETHGPTAMRSSTSPQAGSAISSNCESCDSAESRSSTHSQVGPAPSSNCEACDTAESRSSTRSQVGSAPSSNCESCDSAESRSSTHSQVGSAPSPNSDACDTAESRSSTHSQVGPAPSSNSEACDSAESRNPCNPPMESRSLLDLLLDEADALRDGATRIPRETEPPCVANADAAGDGSESGRDGEMSTVVARRAQGNHNGPRPEPAAGSQRGPLQQRTDASKRAFNRADALVSVAQSYLRGNRPERAPIDVVLTIPAASLRSGVTDAAEVGEIGESFVSCEAARRMSCDCGVVEVVEDEHGTPLSVGRKRRTIAGVLKRALRQRDKTCTFPGCTNRLFLEGHHLRHWADGGETSLENAALLCTAHHHYVHEYGYTIQLDADQRPLFRDPHGRVVAAVPDRPMTPNVGWPAIRAENAALAIGTETIACEWDGTPVDYGRIVGHLLFADGLQ